jgi:DNA-binding winged helix-turn-helix (wHTH) protein
MFSTIPQAQSIGHAYGFEWNSDESSCMSSDNTPTPSQRLHLGPWLIDLEHNTVAIGNNASGITPRAEELLLLLCRHPNRVVSREQILDTVWAGRVVEDATITHCVWQIRKAIGEQGKEVLQTRAKRGYVLTVATDAWILDEADDEPPVDAASRSMQTATATVVDDTASTNDAHDSHTANSMGADSIGHDSIGHDSVRHDSVMTNSAPAHVVRRTWRSPLLLSLAFAVCASLLLGVYLWRSHERSSTEHAQLELPADTEMTVSINVPSEYAWLRDAVLRKAVEQAYLHDIGIHYFGKLQRRNPFSGPHLQVEAVAEDAATIKAQISLNQGGKTIRKSYRGSAQDLGRVVETTLLRGLPPAVHGSGPEVDAFVGGVVADLHSDYLGAIAGYRRALRLDPKFVQVKLAMASRLYALGRSREAQELWRQLSRYQDLSPRQRCQFELLTVKVADEPLKSPKCVRARSFANISEGDPRNTLREVDAARAHPLSASQWINGETNAVMALIDLGELAQAQSRIEQAQAIAAEAGWERVRIEIGTYRAEIASQQGKTDEAIRLKRISAEEMQRVGALIDGLSKRTDAIRLAPPTPGEETAQQRAELNAIIDRSREIGSVHGEVVALYVLLRLDGDDPPRWLAHLQRIRTLANTYYAPRALRWESYYMLIEINEQLRYRDVLEGVKRLDPAKDPYPYSMFGFVLQAHAHAARDELPEALASIDAMERSKSGIDAASACSFAGIFIEAGEMDRARTVLKQCDYSAADRTGMADGGDHALLAEARMLQLGDRPERAWPLLRPRVEALLAFKDLSRDEAQGLALLARYATTMPGADFTTLQRALVVTSAIAVKDGAGPGLRSGVHLLRWRLCAAAGRTDCGPVLPIWDQESLLEARLAQGDRVRN